MENRKLQIEDRLWNFIKRNYNSENYTNAILDSIQFIGDVIREKSGLESDGNQLIGPALGGDNPKIKLNKLTTESDKNFQKGIEGILRGIYSAYRNPRSHSKIEDSEVDAFEVVTFINHLLKIVDKSTGKFSTEFFLKRIFDNDFVPSKKYAELLTKEIPANKFYEISIEIFRAKENGNIANIKLVWECVVANLTDDQRLELLGLAAEDLRYTNSLSVITRCIALFRDSWEKIDEDARLRVENKLVKSLANAEKNSRGTLNESATSSSWLGSIIKKSLLRDEIAEKLFDLLNSDNDKKQRFVIDHFGRHIDDLEPLLLFDSYKDLFKKELGKGNGLIHSFVIKKYKGTEKEAFSSELKDFILASNDDDLPF